jgi:hypothetical protein
MKVSFYWEIGALYIPLIFITTGDKTPPGFPIIIQSPATRVIEIGHTAIMQCKATGQPNPKIYWLKDMKKVDMNNPRYSLLDGKWFDGLFYRVLIEAGNLFGILCSNLISLWYLIMKFDIFLVSYDQIWYLFGILWSILISFWYLMTKFDIFLVSYGQFWYLFGILC